MASRKTEDQKTGCFLTTRESDLDGKKKDGKPKHMWKLKNSLLNDHSKNFTREFGKDLKLNESKNMTYPNLWGTVSARLREKPMYVNANVRETVRLKSST